MQMLLIHVHLLSSKCRTLCLRVAAGSGQRLTWLHGQGQLDPALAHHKPLTRNILTEKIPTVAAPSDEWADVTRTRR